MDEFKTVQFPVSSAGEALEWERHEAKFSCSHDESEIRERTIRGGSTQFWIQCLRCGKPVGQPIKMSSVQKNVPPFDEGLQKSFVKARSDDAESIRLQYRVIRKTEYHRYLQSPAWQRKRLKVLERCGGTCEGCREAQAVEVHHLTYEHIFDELLFELVGLCMRCHSKIHDPEPQIDDEYDSSPCADCRWQGEVDGVRWCSLSDGPTVESLDRMDLCGPLHQWKEPLK